MTEKKYTLKQVNAMIKDESHAVKDYRKKGLTTFANQEKQHLTYWKNEKKKFSK